MTHSTSHWMTHKWGAGDRCSRRWKRPGSSSSVGSQGTWCQSRSCKIWNRWRPPWALVLSEVQCRNAKCNTQDLSLLPHWWMAGSWEPGKYKNGKLYTCINYGKNQKEWNLYRKKQLQSTKSPWKSCLQSFGVFLVNYLAMCAGSIFKMKDGGYDNTCY